MTPNRSGQQPAQPGPRRLFAEPRARLVLRRFGVATLALLALAAVLSDARYWLLPLGVVYGFVWWTFLEYLMHRFLLHWRPEGSRGLAIAGRLPLVAAHLDHHETPLDAAGALTTKHAIAWPVGAILFLGMLVLGFPLSFALAAMAGGSAGYLAYELVHYACHRPYMTTRYGKLLRRHHALHHHADERANFGVTSPVWDWVFRTTYRPGV